MRYISYTPQGNQFTNIWLKVYCTSQISQSCKRSVW